jgi:hypothetical protein
MKKNPFPGMNPWLESHWGDVHTCLTTYARDQLHTQLPDGLRARIEEYVAVEADELLPGSRSRFAPDVRVIERAYAPAAEVPDSVGTTALAEPLLLPRRSELETLHFIKIIDMQTGERIVTTIEFISLANKLHKEGRKQYRKKQRRMLGGGVNLVEIDLLRAGQWVLAVPRSAIPRAHRHPYNGCVVRAEQQDIAEFYPLPLSRLLPAIRIPLRKTDHDVRLELQPLIDAAYVNGRYYDDLEYTQEPQPPLTRRDAEWADRHLRELGLR